MKKLPIVFYVCMLNLLFSIEIEVLGIDRYSDELNFNAYESLLYLWYADNDDLLFISSEDVFFYKQGLAPWSFGEREPYSLDKEEIRDLIVRRTNIKNTYVTEIFGQKEFLGLIKYKDNEWKWEIASKDLSGLKLTSYIGDEFIEKGSDTTGEWEGQLIPLDFNYYIYLKPYSPQYARKHMTQFFIVDKNLNEVINYNEYRQKLFMSDQYIGLRFENLIYDSWTGVACHVTVNSKQNTIAVIMQNYDGKNSGLLILSIIYDGVVNDGRVRLRNEPNLQSQTLGHVNTGDKVKIIDRSNKKQKIEEMEAYWYKVELTDGKTGWVYGAYVDVQ